MEQALALTERIKALKAIAASMHDGRAYDRIVPEVDKVLALPDDVGVASVSEREAIARQVREHEQAFDRLGYSLLDQIMPATGVSSVFRVVQAADEFKARLRGSLGRTVRVGEKTLVLEGRHLDALSRYSLSIGTPPVTAGMRELVCRTVLGADIAELRGHVEMLDCDPVALDLLLGLLEDLASTSLHYSTAAEERAFLREAAEFINFEGSGPLNRVVVTESPDRVIDLIRNHVFDKFGAREVTAVRIVDGIDAVGDALIDRMRAEPNQVFVARVTRIPHRLFDGAERDAEWRSVVGRLLLIDDSPRARLSNATVVYTLFPHVARTLRNVQTSFAGRPANTQLVLRRILERFPTEALRGIREALDRGLERLEAEGARNAGIDEIRAHDWRRDALLDDLALRKLRRVVAFVETLSQANDVQRHALGAELRDRVAADWMKYFYSGLPSSTYHAAVLPGGGRGALTLSGEYHRQVVREAVERFRATDLPACLERLEALKTGLRIPKSSSDEIEAAIRQSQRLALSPTQWQSGEAAPSRAGYLARALVYRAADAAGKLTRRTETTLDRAAFSNLTGGAAALIKQTMSKAGLSALHGHLEDRFGKKLGEADRRVRKLLAPFQEAVRQVQRSTDDLRGGMDPMALADIEALLQAVQRDAFFPTLILPEMSWTYGDVFPEKYFPTASTIRVPLNRRYEMDPPALLKTLEALRYQLRGFPELFDLHCRSMLLLVNTPHNPTGVAYRRETLLKLLQIAAEYDITVLDDNAYHRLVTRRHKAREGDRCVAQVYEAYREHFTRPVRIVTVGATTKGLQGSGDRTGLVHSNVAAAVEYVERTASQPHLMSLYMTRLKLESGLAVKRFTRDLEQLAGQILRPSGRVSATDRMRVLLEQTLKHAADDNFPVAAFTTLLEGYEDLLRVQQRGATVTHLSELISRTVRRLKDLRLEVRLRTDVEERLARFETARAAAVPDREHIEPDGAFYACVRLCPEEDDRGVQDFLVAIARHRKVDVTYAGHGFIRVSLGGTLKGDAKGYERYGQAIELYLGLLSRYWEEFERRGRDPAQLDAIFAAEGGADPLAAMLTDLAPLLEAEAGRKAAPQGDAIGPAERGIVFCIEEGRSIADKVFIEWQDCDSVDELLHSQAFRVVFRRLLKKVSREHPELLEMTFAEVENQYGPLACLRAYHDRQRIDPLFRDLLQRMYALWHGQSTIKVLAAKLDAARHDEKIAALHGLHRKLNDLLNELMHAFEIPDEKVTATTTFEVGYEALVGVHAHSALPEWLRRLIEGTTFAGATAALNPTPSMVTGAAKRVADYRYGFSRRDASETGSGTSRPGLDLFRRRLDAFARSANCDDYVCKAVPVGPFKMLTILHKSCFHLVNDEMRLFPEIESMQAREALDAMDWDGVMLYGIPSKSLGDSYRTGYVLDHKATGELFPIAWVAREDATDYVGFFKKTLLTMHNERVKGMGGMPVHGAMITITFKNGLRKTLVFSADSGTGKSETITAMMDQLVSGVGRAAEVRSVDILSGDMLSLWRGEDGQVYAFGTEQGDFLRLNDITESWKARFGDLLKRGSYSNLDHPTNPRVTIPGICDPKKLLKPTRVNGFFYINNYEGTRGSAVELIDDPNHVLKAILVRGLRRNKGTSGNPPSLRAGLEFAGRSELVVRYRHEIDEVLDWQDRKVDGKTRSCLVYRDGTGDVFTARDLVASAFREQSFQSGGRTQHVHDLEYDILENRFDLDCDGGARIPLTREVYDQVFEPLASTFCGNPFVDPEGMDRTLDVFAETMRGARVHVGVIRTQLARAGYEFSGPAKAAQDIISFLLEDEEVNARFQRNKDKVHQAMQRAFGGVLEAGSNLPVELEGYNLLLLEAHESTHVAFLDAEGRSFGLSTPFYRFDPAAGAGQRTFAPSSAMPEMIATLADIIANPEHEIDLTRFDADLAGYDAIRFWSSREELVYQILLLNGVVEIGSSETDVARFPLEVRKADHVAERIVKMRAPDVGGWTPRLRVIADARVARGGRRGQNRGTET